MLQISLSDNMDLTQGTEKEKHDRAKKMMLWFGIVSLLMSFAGWTSAFVVSSSREDWLDGFKLPSAFTVSVVLIILSSVAFILAKRALKSGNVFNCNLRVRYWLHCDAISRISTNHRIRI
jgi:heme/copper-type cytochrome/quinol oxidase subunit 3